MSAGFLSTTGCINAIDAGGTVAELTPRLPFKRNAPKSVGILRIPSTRRLWSPQSVSACSEPNVASRARPPSDHVFRFPQLRCRKTSSEGFFLRLAHGTAVVLLARRLQLNMFLVQKVSRTTPEDDLLKSRPCHEPCREEMSKFCVRLGSLVDMATTRIASDTRLFAFPLINGHIPPP